MLVAAPMKLDVELHCAEGLDLVLWDLAQVEYLEESESYAETIQEELNQTLGLAEPARLMEIKRAAQYRLGRLDTHGRKD